MGSSGSASVLVAEDDRSVRDSLERVLRFEGYEVTTAKDGAEALDALTTQVPDACRMMRERYPALPILMLTARHEVADRVAGLDAGADDYLVKPFALDELLARLRALVRRTSVSGTSDVLELADLRLDPLRRQAWRGQRPLDLTKTEFDLLEILLLNAGIVLTRETLYDRIWGFDFETGSRSLDVYIGYLRRKTEENDEPRIVHTVRGVGYVARAQ